MIKYVQTNKAASLPLLNITNICFTKN